MIKIIDTKKETKKYIEAVNTLFRVYRIDGSLDKRYKDISAFYKTIAALKADELYKGDPLKKTLVSSHLLEGHSLSDVAKKNGIFHVSYIHHTSGGYEGACYAYIRGYNTISSYAAVSIELVV